MTELQERPRRVTPTRLVALAVIAVLSAGLVALNAAGRDSQMTVPAGAHAGQLSLHDCTYATEDGGLPADCGTLVVPENRQDPSSRLIALPVTRVHAKSAHPGAPVFYLQGGPGITNMVFPYASRFVANHDVVVVGYRGVDGSVRLDCPEVVSALSGSHDLIGASTLKAYSRAFGQCASRLQKSGVDLAGYNSVERVDDMEAARTALGYSTVDLVSESAGTRTAMIYSWRHRQSVHRSVMLGANPPGHYMYDGATTDEQIRDFSKLCKADQACSAGTADLEATMKDLAPRLPDRWLFLPIKPGNVKLATFYGLVHSTSAAAPLTAPQTIDSWTAAAHGDASGLWLLSLMADLSVPESHVWGDMPATGQLDADAVAAHYARGGDHSILDNALGDSIWGAGGLVQAWPHATEVDEYRQLRPTDVETLVISGDLDLATPAVFATRELMPTLKNGHQVVLKNLGHTEDTWHYEKAASNRLINTFLDTGRIDDSGYPERAMDFTASTPQTRIAKIALTSVAGLALLAVIALLWLAGRLRRRGSVGAKTSFVTRALLAPVIGLGGWCLGLLVLLTAWPSQSIAFQPASVLFIGAPVGLAVYVGWARRSWLRRDRMVGMALAFAGAGVGSWLGLFVAPGLMSVFTASVGAVLGANLAVLLNDLVRGPGRPRADVPEATDDQEVSHAFA